MADIEYDLSELMKGSDEAVKAVMKGLEKGVYMGAERVKIKAVELCPTSNVEGSPGGALKDSIEMHFKNTDDVFEGVVGTTQFYAPYVEYGTGQRGVESNPVYEGETPVQHSADWRGMEAQPFLRPAFYNNQKKVSDLIGKYVMEELSKVNYNR